MWFDIKNLIPYEIVNGLALVYTPIEVNIGCCKSIIQLRELEVDIITVLKNMIKSILKLSMCD